MYYYFFNTHRRKTMAPSPSKVSSCTACATTKCFTVPYTCVIVCVRYGKRGGQTCVIVCVRYEKKGSDAWLVGCGCGGGDGEWWVLCRLVKFRWVAAPTKCFTVPYTCVGWSDAVRFGFWWSGFDGWSV